MIAETTYYDEEVKNEFNKLLGKPYTLTKIFKTGVIGSSRMPVKDCSMAFKAWVESTNDLVQASIELRPKGILVVLAKSYHNISWAIPYHFLSVFKSDVLSIHAKGEYLKLQLREDQNRKFLAKLLQNKANYLNPV